MSRLRALVVATLAVFCMAAGADPAEQLPDPAQEARARALFQEVRCVVCQNESIDDSDAEIARDLRMLVREQVAAGRSDEEVKDFLVERYGDFVLFRPRFSGLNLVLWLAPFAILLAAGAFLLARARARAGVAQADRLTPEEEAELALLESGQVSAEISSPDQPEHGRRVT